jgi:Domain of unknown function (DUF4440)
MKHAATSKLLAVLAVLVLAAAGAAAAASIATARAASSPAEQVRALERTRLKAMVDADTGTVGRQLAPDFQGINVLGVNDGRSGTLATIGGGVDFVSITPVSPIKVRLYGNTAAARFEVAFVVVAGPDRVEHRGWFTDLLEKRAGNWQLVWSQTTAVPNDAALFVQSLKPHA